MVKCKEVPCINEVYAYGFCKKHHNEHIYQFKKKIPCIIEGCTNGQKSKGLCSKHYRKLKKCLKCKRTIFKEDLCKNHYAKEHSQCSFPDCEEKEIFCASKMLCKKHYKYSQRAKKKDYSSSSNVSTPNNSDRQEFEYMDFLIT